MTNKYFKFIIYVYLHECVLIYMASIIYVVNCIDYALEFIHTALFIHTVSVTCTYTYRILKYVCCTHRIMFALPVIYCKNNEYFISSIGRMFICLSVHGYPSTPTLAYFCLRARRRVGSSSYSGDFHCPYR